MKENLAKIVTKEHILKALQKFDREKPNLIGSTKFDVVYNGNLYPPKEVIREAARLQGIEISDENHTLGGGDKTNNYLEQKGFTIVQKQDPIKRLIEAYKKHIQKTHLEHEIYKWKLISEFSGRPNTDAVDFYKEIKSIKYKNMVYQMAIPVVHQLSKVNAEELRALFKMLFDEKIALTTRLNIFNTETLKIFRNLGETLPHHQDERTIASYLTFHNPKKYTFYKSSFYTKLCNLLKVKSAKKNEKYPHYLELLNQIIDDYIQEDEELRSLVKSFIPEQYDGDNLLLLTQDILYQMFDINEIDKKSEINLKKEYIDWMIANDEGRFYFSKQFGSNREKFQAEIDNYETTYQECFYEDLFIIDTTNFRDNITSIRTNIYDKNNPFSTFSKERASGRPMAMLGNKNYLKFLHDYFMPNDTMNKLLVNISWNSKDWKEESKDFSNHSWVKDGGIPHESWNFAIDAEGNTEDYLFGYAKFTHPPKIEGKTIFIFYSDGKIVGFYGDASLKLAMRNGQPLNLSGRKALSFVLENKIENILDKGFFEDGKRIGQIGFNYLKKNETVIKILDEALGLNPNQTNEINRLKNWFLHETEIPETMNDNLNFNAPLNQILYGPPGTGKTYNTVLEAAKIITGNENINYVEALKVFTENLGNQLEFITFHQNYSYEDFIQGLRPDTDNGNALTFEKKDGVFKRIADRALKNLESSKNPATAKKDFDIVFQELIKPLNEGDVEELEIKMKKSSFYITEVGEKSIEFRKNIGDSNHTLSINTLRKMYDKGFNELILGGLQPYYNPILELLLEKGKSNLQSVNEEKFVIIIDEINRANISRVFGELITLIEEDKRSHGKIPMRVTLPSGDPFSVPSNLHIIGTMNTADKSIALLDIALRRRFEFVPMYPDTTLEAVHDKEILEAINKAILDRKNHDFTIGHAYFMGDEYSRVKTINNKVIPLLLEYFMNDEKEVIAILKAANLTVGDWPLKLIS